MALQLRAHLSQNVCELFHHAYFDIPKTIMDITLESRKSLTRATELRPLSAFDRIALHGGLALIRWARRAEQAPRLSFHTLSRRSQNALAAAIQRRELVEATHRLGLAR